MLFGVHHLWMLQQQPASPAVFKTNSATMQMLLVIGECLTGNQPFCIDQSVWVRLIEETSELCHLLLGSLLLHALSLVTLLPFTAVALILLASLIDRDTRHASAVTFRPFTKLVPGLVY